MLVVGPSPSATPGDPGRSRAQDTSQARAPAVSVGPRGAGSGEIPPTNVSIAEALDEVARLLEARDAGRFRVEAYRRAAETLRGLGREAVAVVREKGREGLVALPGIGEAIAHAITEVLESGRLRLLDRLGGEVDPEGLFASLPGVGPELARRIHRKLGIDTLEELELAAWNGRLDRVPGFGPRRTEALRSVLDTRLSRRRSRLAPGSPSGAVTASGADAPQGELPEPTVPDLLSVDAEYRLKAEAGALRLIAPRRFNPRGVAWLPILRSERGPWSLDALFSNTLDAHRRACTRDWVVIRWRRDGIEGLATVVTERRGDLAGQRVVRGREEACRRHYAERTHL